MQAQEYQQKFQDAAAKAKDFAGEKFAQTSDKFKELSNKDPKELVEEAKELYSGREAAFTAEILRKVERDIYLQILDDLWMQHLENMDHLREGIHWMSVGQQDPLVEYRRRGQQLFDAMQHDLRHNVLRTLFHAEPVDAAALQAPVETELTRAARGSISNASQINQDEEQFDETDFKPKKTEVQAKREAHTKQKKARKQERKRKTQARKRK